MFLGERIVKLVICYLCVFVYVRYCSNVWGQY